MNKKFKTLMLAWAMVLWHWNLKAQDLTPTITDSIQKTKTELVMDLSQENLDSLYDISGKIEEILSSIDKNNMINIHYWKDEFKSKLKHLENEYENEIKRLKLDGSLFKYGEEEFDKRMDNIKKKIESNPYAYGSFDSKWNFIIRAWAYKRLIKEEFPEFYDSCWDTRDDALKLWQRKKDSLSLYLEKYEYYINMENKREEKQIEREENKIFKTLLISIGLTLLLLHIIICIRET